MTKKIAILMSGGLRTFWYSIDNILNNIIIPNNADVYIYTGYDNYDKNMDKIYIDNYTGDTNKCSMIFSRENRNNIENKILYMNEYEFIKNKLGNYLKDIKFYQDINDDINEFENDYLKRVEIFKNYKNNQKITDSHYGPQKYILEQYFRIYKCNEMKKEYENKNEFKYDYCMRLRPDFYYDNIINLNKINIQNNSIYAPNDYGYYLQDQYVAEWFYFGDNNTMNKMTSDFYNNIIYFDTESYRKEYMGFNVIKSNVCTFVPEVQFSKGSCLNNINLKLVNIRK
jgi:hypothetical protein